MRLRTPESRVKLAPGLRRQAPRRTAFQARPKAPPPRRIKRCIPHETPVSMRTLAIDSSLSAGSVAALTPEGISEELLPEAGTHARRIAAALRDLAVYDQPANVQANDGAVSESTLILEGISCAACVWLIEQRLSRLHGVTGAEINFTSLRARVRWDSSKLRLSEIIAAIGAIGYRAYPYDRERAERSRHAERIHRIAM